MKRVFISTTNTVDNGKIKAFYGVVSSHIVAGTGFLTDLAASFSDLFGGRSGAYQRQLESLYDDALDDISSKTSQLGGNCILGLRIDLDNISGKGMSMFMITAVGTAAKVEFDEPIQPAGTTETITSAVLVNEIAKRSILQILDETSSNQLPLKFHSKHWETILKYPDNDYILPLTRRFFENAKDISDYNLSFRKNYGHFIQMVDRQHVVKAVYEGMTDEESISAASSLIREHYLFDAKSILSLLKEGHTNQVLTILKAEQPSYTKNDLYDMEAVLDALDNLPDVGKKEVVKGGMFSKDGEKYVCQYGHKNNPDVEFCNDCGENIKGLTRDDIELIAHFKNRVAVLRDLINAID